MGYSKTAQKRYFLEVIAVVALFVGIILSRAQLAQWTGSPALLFAIKFLPLLAMVLIAGSVWRLYRARDEFQRQTMLKTGAAAMLLSLVLFMLLPTLRMLGALPLPPNFPGALVILSVSIVVCGLAFSFVDKRAEAGTRRALTHIAPWLLVFLVPAAWWLLSLILPLPHLTLRQGLICLCVVIVGISFYRIFVRPEEQ